MNVYRLLGDYLSKQQSDHVNLTFQGVEQILGRPLPPSARNRAEWWANNYSSPSRHCWPGWLAAGWQVETHNLHRETVAFSRDRSAKSGTPGSAVSARVPAIPAKQVLVDEGAATMELVATREWYWEGNVQNAVVSYLKAEGWSVERSADTAAHEHGIDIPAVRDGRTLAVEVKGYPPPVYTFGARKGEHKPAPQARLQAEHFFAQGLHAAIKTRAKHPYAELTIALPNSSHYHALLREADWALSRLGIGAYVVTENGKVQLALSH